MSRIEVLAEAPKHSAAAAAEPVLPQARQSTPAAQQTHRLLSKLLRRFARLLNRHFLWHTLPGKWLGYGNLALQREVLRRFNLHDTRRLPSIGVRLPECDGDARVARTPDGSCNDVQDPEMGQAGTRFGRNVPLRYEDPRLLDPDPRIIADRLLAREKIKEATGLNLLAAAWIQFMIHDWFSHGEPDGEAQPIELPARAGEPPLQIRRTARDKSRGSNERGPLSYQNTQTHWSDASQIYGSSWNRVKKLRSGRDGKLSIGDDGLLPLGEDGVDLTGVHDNWWVGLSLLHTLFAREHNAICDMLLRQHPERKWTDDSLFDCARLVNAALMAKIHVLEWTATTGAHPSLELGVKLAWWGLLGERMARIFGRFGGGELLSGIPGSRTDHHHVPYAMTEEFVAVYRMHPLIRDDYRLRRHTNDEPLRECNLFDIAGKNTRKLMREVAMEDLWYSFGTIPPGQVRLRNYPQSLRQFKRQGVELDVAVLDIVRDRERGVPRYNEFRELMHLPRRQRFEELSSDPDLVRQLEEVYDNDIDRVDLMVGMYAEEPPPGFAFSDTAFRVFILMASRRLQSDRFFTADYRPEIYTEAGMEWIDDNDMKKVLLRHYPALTPVLTGHIFKPWKAGK